MAGVYIHIPFCSKACHYCNFHFSTSLHRKSAMVQAIVLDIQHHRVPAGVVTQRQINTIYFGGGTPSVLTAAELELLLQTIHRHFEVAAGAEITFEANPDDITAERLDHWLQAGINRLSLGVQSFRDEDLIWMNRAHRADASLKSIEAIRRAGFTNFSIDLMYGLPQLTDAAWQQNLEMAISLGVPHLSCYALTVEEKTALHHFIKRGKAKPPDEQRQQSQFSWLAQRATAAGYRHYEISNLALPGAESRHNSSYWDGTAYYGFGPSAHSFDGHRTRWWQPANNALYIAAMQAGNGVPEHEHLSETDRINEALMTGLRRDTGIPVDHNGPALSGVVITPSDFEKMMQRTQRHVAAGHLLVQPDRWLLTAEGRFFADGIAADLFL